MRDDDYTTIDSETNSEINQNAKINRYITIKNKDESIISYCTENKNDGIKHIKITDEDLCLLLDDFVINYKLMDLIDLYYANDEIEISDIDIKDFIYLVMNLFLINERDFITEKNIKKYNKNIYNNEENYLRHNKLVQYIINQVQPVVNKFVAELEKIRKSKEEIVKPIVEETTNPVIIVPPKEETKE